LPAHAISSTTPTTAKCSARLSSEETETVWWPSGGRVEGW
jgi:hypothetical protein